MMTNNAEEKRKETVKQLIESIERNPAAWERGWYTPKEYPHNGKTGRAYNGLNALWLMMLGEQRGYKDARWVTYNQAKELGASVKRGEKSTNVFFWTFYDKKTKKAYDETSVSGLTDEERKEYVNENVRPVLKSFAVFNAEQYDRFPEATEAQEMSEAERKEENGKIERIIGNSAAPILYDGGNRAYYSPGSDSIHLPKIEQFKTKQDYYATALHEIAHSTGHPSRLNRDLSGSWGDGEYAKEELRAELASVFMQIENGIRIDGAHFENHASYLKSWLAEVRKDENEFYAAVRDAEKISDYIAKNYLNAELKESAEEEGESEKEISKSEGLEEITRGEAETKNAEAEAEPIFDNDAIFSEEVDAVLSGADTTSTHIKVMNTPKILRDVGLPDLPILITAKHLKSITQESGKESMNYHGLSVRTVKRLPEQLADPIAVMDSLTRDDSVVVLTELKDKENRPVIAAVKMNGRGYLKDIEIEANILTSVYGKDNFERFLERNVEAGTILYWNKEKSQSLSVNPGIQFPDVMASIDSDIIIRKAKGFVNSFGEKSTKEAGNIVNRNKEKSQTLAIPGIQFPDNLQTIDFDIIIRKAKGFVNSFGEKNSEKAEKNMNTEENTGKMPAKAEQVGQVEQAKAEVAATATKSEWKTTKIATESIMKDYGGSAMIRMPEGEYRSFVFYAPKKSLQEREDGTTEFRVRSDGKYVLKNDGAEVELSGEELLRALSGAEVGKTAQRVAPRKRNAERLNDLEKNVPEEMKRCENWCAYRIKYNEEKGRYDKFVISPRDGKWAKANDRSTWVDFESALRFAREKDCAGLSFALDGTSGITCIDLDESIRDDGSLTASAEKLSEELSGTYAETSVSGNGIHIFVVDDVLKKRYKNRAELSDGELEVYDNVRFISMTGNKRSESTELTKVPTETLTWIRERLGEKTPEREHTVRAETRKSDVDVIERIRRSKKGREFDTLMSGGSVTGDKSRDDMMLLNMLAFFTDCDKEQMQAIYKTSERSDERGGNGQAKSGDYLERSIDKACATLKVRIGGKGNYTANKQSKGK